MLLEFCFNFEFCQNLKFYTFEKVAPGLPPFSPLLFGFHYRDVQPSSNWRTWRPVRVLGHYFLLTIFFQIFNLLCPLSFKDHNEDIWRTAMLFFCNLRYLRLYFSRTRFETANHAFAIAHRDYCNFLLASCLPTSTPPTRPLYFNFSSLNTEDRSTSMTSACTKIYCSSSL